eukprot:CAMPEP_0184352898 /NCGR_PEP_ID=MMETSP1089-20130417/72249_1 /TAXON_ID=38269 ORGANISM="Gloeochaete wittrockiana, Strain SAG46.84" /NCGR_SAMPLE_ID=MMETSP1089 /ASSEMBLY_ACC=CAM_ASM_000445 /LENGTH=107 /DNA_ID=CAMNT_0026687887 /DNA_START=30 /DNA_END=349 /DNA_ORIENTATION=+
MLFGQSNLTPLPPLPASVSSFADENSFLDIDHGYWLSFLRPDAAKLSRKTVARYCTQNNFKAVDDDVKADPFRATNSDLHLFLESTIGLNSNEELLIKLLFGSTSST